MTNWGFHAHTGEMIVTVRASFSRGTDIVGLILVCCYTTLVILMIRSDARTDPAVRARTARLAGAALRRRTTGGAQVVSLDGGAPPAPATGARSRGAMLCVVEWSGASFESWGSSFRSDRLHMFSISFTTRYLGKSVMFEVMPVLRNVDLGQTT